jgi:hypothetical protein
MMCVFRVFVVITFVFAVPACDRGALEGRVTDMHGDALPGVIVRVAGSSDQDLTDGLGRYKVAAAPGNARLEFSKSGYTSSELVVTANSRGDLPDAMLWILPLNPGVYVVNDLRFVETQWAVPKQHNLTDGTLAYGIELPEHVVESAGEPFIVAHRTTRYNARLSRLTQDEASLQGVEKTSIPVWVEAGTMAAALEPLDAHEGLLMRVQVGRPLEPGVYGVHWGALEGYTTLDNRVYVFRIPEPPAEAEASSAEGETSAATKETAAPVEESGDQKPETTSAPKKDEKKADPAAPPQAPAPKPVEPDILEPTDETFPPPA